MNLRFVAALLLPLTACPGLPGGGPDSGMTVCGLGCKACGETRALGTDPLCTTGTTCTSDATCAMAVPMASCEPGLGVAVHAFAATGCLQGVCAYRVKSNTCSDLTPCAACAPHAGCGDQSTAGACARCCSSTALEFALSECLCAACTGCAGQLCGTVTDAGVSDACAQCAVAALTGSGACVASDTFQSQCIGAPACRFQAQCLASCRR